MNNRINISSNSPWEDIVGYSRAVKINDMVFVSGTTGVNEVGNFVGIGDVYKQTIQCIENIKIALEKADSSLADVVRIRIFVVNISEWENVGRVLNSYFKEIKPAATMVEVSNLITPEALVEIEADAVISNSSRNL